MAVKISPPHTLSAAGIAGYTTTNFPPVILEGHSEFLDGVG